MNLIIIGASGFVGTAVREEALERGHTVTAIVRNPGRLPNHPRLTALKGDVFDIPATTGQLRGHDAIISAFFTGPAQEGDDVCQRNVDAYRAIIAAARTSGVKRILIVGGAGSLEVAPGVRLVDTPQFPAEIRPKALAACEVLEMIRGNEDLEWSFISPSPLLKPGRRTGIFRTGRDQVLMGEGGPTWITVADLAVAILDEIGHPRHLRNRFTVGY
ncbi:NAD(P)-dependent oxidoreductase [Geobacter sp. AOG1]|uniref:NAD(P)-dependent oxidoreductase n=1 Tax=Geobacter sp. AOG1 TaxID=1566346 RepID=UPI001CC49062|nr:NAD(P)-dependent oxidoreductase [Geobacter sp. AOG1]GFE56325.1 3-beta hydroxysteroid dehydrogenase [Geobacter sp. AOG1]